MKGFPEIRRATRRLCSDYAAGAMGLGALELGVAELMRQRAGCQAVALWRRAGRGACEELLCLGRSYLGRLHDERPAPVPSDTMADYLAWMREERILLNDSTSPGNGVIAQAWRLHCDAATAFLHVPTFYNGALCGVVCFSNHDRHLALTGRMRRDLQELISLVMLYVSPQLPNE